MALPGAATLLWLAAWCGMMAGLGEVLLLGVQKFIFHRAIFLGPRVIWMAAAADLLLFGALGLVQLALSAGWRQLRTVRFTVALYVFAAVFGWLLIFPRIQWYASLLLAGGLAVQAGRITAARLLVQPSFISRAVKLTATLILLLCAGVEGSLWWREHRAVSALPNAPTDAPNVLLIVMDTVRAQNLSLYGYAQPTSPQLERLARSGVQFNQAIATAPWTLPSHASMFTGRYPQELSADFLKPLDATYPTLAETLRARGWLTAGFVANTYYCGYEHGLARGFVHYEDYRASLTELLISSSLLRAVTHNAPLRRLLGNQQVLTRRTAAELNGDLLNWLARNSDVPRRPFFAFLNYYDAHEPYLPPGAKDDSPLSRWPHEHTLRTARLLDRDRLSERDNQAEIAAYDRAITFLDDQLGRLFDELARRDLLRNTLVIITSDHGEAFGEHGHYGHADNLYLPLLHVPLLVIAPGRVPAGLRINAPVTLRDLPATILEIVTRGSSPLPGNSLARFWNGAASDSAILSAVNLAPIKPRLYPAGSNAEMRSVVQGPYHYIKAPDEREELYDLRRDPDERHDLTEQDEYGEVIEQLRRIFEQTH
ncbi:MAG: sulfatase-like hydrolase/transferase [Blastocatellia bacterium]